MAVLVGVSQASVLVRPWGIRAQKSRSTSSSSSFPGFRASPNSLHCLRFKSDNNTPFTGIVLDSKAASFSTSAVDSREEEIKISTDSSGGDSNNWDNFGNGGGGRGGGGDNKGEGEGEFEEDSSKTNKAMSMSQKLTLGYAALVGVGGIMGYVKSGSQKSLLAGGISASLLFYVYTLLPTNPALASSLGLGLSATLLAVMGSRFKKSGKIFPAGIVSVVSLIMTGGYLHGILRSMH